MSIQVTIVDHETKPVEPPKDLILVLIGDGKPLAQGTANGHGIVQFDVSIEGVKHLSLRAGGPPLGN